jgi:hypothetical protein
MTEQNKQIEEIAILVKETIRELNFFRKKIYSDIRLAKKEAQFELNRDLLLIEQRINSDINLIRKDISFAKIVSISVISALTPVILAGWYVVDLQIDYKISTSRIEVKENIIRMEKMLRDQINNEIDKLDYLKKCHHGNCNRCSRQKPNCAHTLKR